MKMQRWILIGAVLGATIAVDAAAQRGAAFSSVSFNGGRQWDWRESNLYPRWIAEPRIEAFVSAPFHFGRVEIGAMQHNYEPLDDDLPHFDATFIYAAWNVGVRFPEVMRWSVGPRVGAYFMEFDVEAFRGEQTESELAIGAQARLTVDVTRWLGWYIGISYLETLTRVPVKNYHFSLGANITIQSPDWLVGVLR